MDITNILPQLERLDGDIDNLEETLQPLLGSLTDVSSKLPLLDRAKLWVLVTYAIESMLFSSLRLNGVDVKDHPVFKELTRVRQYFDKIKSIETPPAKREATLNKEAAIRFIKADLADNKEISSQLSEMIAKERAKVAVTASKSREKRKSVESDSSSEAGSDSEEPPPKKKSKTKKDKKHKKKKKASK